jgi:outer membrane receptor protein involved in Fe transport
MFSKKLLGGAAFTALTLALGAQSALAQETTSSMRGDVITEAGAAVANAQVVITHVPTGTRTTVLTDEGGRFDARNLRIGGPYTVEVTAQNYTSERVTDINLTLGSPFRLAVELADAGAEIVVTAARLNVASRDFQPGSTQFDASRIDTIATARRDIRDIARQDPRVTVDPTNGFAPQIAGNNNRFNNFVVDGVKAGDDFGLNSSGLPTQRSPVTIEAIEQLAISATPFDVQYGQFQGGSFNVVTRSGTNEFSGSLSYQYKGDDLAAGSLGVRGGGGDRPLNLNFEDKTWVATLGGPIIKDRLFFFVSYEDAEGFFGETRGPSDSSFLNRVPGVTVAEVSQLASIMSGAPFSYSVGNVPDALDNSDRKVLAKLDWNITEAHRAAFTYNRNETVDPRNGINPGAAELLLSTNYYDVNETVQTAQLQLFSDWTPNFSTEFAASWREKNNDQAPKGGKNSGMWSVCTRPTTPTGTTSFCLSPEGSVTFGGDRSRHSNVLNTDGYNLKAKGDLALGAHRITFGGEFDRQNIFNLFVQDANGSVEFLSFADLQNRVASRIRFAAACTGLDITTCSLNRNNAAATFSIDTITAYIQDRWDVTDRLTLVGGLRYDQYASEGLILTNPGFQAAYGFSNNQTLDGRDVVSPRFGFDYDVADNIKVFGGVGKFAGGTPNVWVSNNYQNDGIRVRRFEINRFGSGAALAAAGTVAGQNLLGIGPTPVANRNQITNQDAYLAFLLANPQSAARSTNSLDPGFKIPAVWRASLGLDGTFDLPWIGDLNVKLEALYTTVDQAIFYRDLNLRPVGTFADGRIRYGLRDTTVANDLQLTNTKKGNGEVYSIALSKDWDNGIDAGFSYTRQEVTDVNPGTSSVAFSNWTNRAVISSEVQEKARSDYETKDRFTLRLGWEGKVFGDNKTSVSLFGENRTGKPLSYTFNSLGTSGVFLTPSGFGTRGLLYVPTGPNDPVVDLSGMTATMQTDFFAFLARSGLNDYAGRIAPRNAFDNKDVTTFDLRFSQEFPGLMKGHKSSLFFDIENFGNLINSDWGILEQFSFPQTVVVVDGAPSTLIDAQGRQRIRYTNFRTPAQLSPTACPSSTIGCRTYGFWTIQAGVRYKF